MNLNQITVPAADVAATVEFYKRLGLKLIVDSNPRYARFECPNGDLTFSIHHHENFTPNAYLVIYFECEDPDGNQLCLFSAGEIRKNPPWRVS